MHVKDKTTGKMREETAEEKTTREAAEAAAAAGEDGDEDEEETDVAKLQAEVVKWKGLSRKNETRAKENKAAADELKELKDKQLTAEQKAAQDKKDSDDRAAKAEKETLRLRVAMRMGLSDVQARRLVGETEEELEADAKDLLATFKPVKDDEEEEEGNGTTRTPRETIRPRSGTGKVKEVPFDAKKVVDAVMDRGR